MFAHKLSDQDLDTINDMLARSSYKSIVGYMTHCLTRHHENFKRVMENPRDVDANVELDLYYQRVNVVYQHVFKTMPEMYDDFVHFSEVYVEALEKF